jgi:hypothetical protein
MPVASLRPHSGSDRNKDMAHSANSDSDGRGLFHPQESCAKCGEVLDRPINLDPLAQRPLPAMKGPLPGDTNLTHLGSARPGLDALDQLAKLLLEFVEVCEQFGLEHNEQIPVVLIGVER